MVIILVLGLIGGFAIAKISQKPSWWQLVVIIPSAILGWYTIYLIRLL